MNGWLIAGIAAVVVLALLAGAGTFALLQLIPCGAGRHKADRMHRDSGSGPAQGAGPDPAPGPEPAPKLPPLLGPTPAGENYRPDPDYVDHNGWNADGTWQPRPVPPEQLITAPPAGDWQDRQWRDMPPARQAPYFRQQQEYPNAGRSWD